MDRLCIIDNLREEEGLHRNSHTTLDDVVDQIRKGGECIRVEECFIDVE